MRRVLVSKYLLPSLGKKQPHVSNWKMTSEEAAALGAISIVPGTTEPRDIPDSDEERRRVQAHYQSAGRDGVQPPAQRLSIDGEEVTGITAVRRPH